MGKGRNNGGEGLYNLWLGFLEGHKQEGVKAILWVC